MEEGCSLWTRCKPEIRKFILVGDEEEDIGVLWMKERADRAGMAEAEGGWAGK